MSSEKHITDNTSQITGLYYRPYQQNTLEKFYPNYIEHYEQIAYKRSFHL